MDIFNNLSPMTILIGVLVLWFFIGKFTNSISESKKNNDNDLEGDNKTLICPYCAEEIKIDAIFCKHCGAEYNKTRKNLGNWVRGNSENSNEVLVGGLVGGFLIIFLIIILFFMVFAILSPLMSWFSIYAWLDSL